MPQTDGHTSQEQQVVLIVDDEADILEIYDFFLSSKGYKVITATTPEAALASIDTMNVFLMITDFRLPVMDGACLCNLVRTKYPVMPLVMISAFEVEAREALQPYNLDLIELINKPINGKDLIKLVDKYAQKTVAV